MILLIDYTRMRKTFREGEMQLQILFRSAIADTYGIIQTSERGGIRKPAKRSMDQGISGWCRKKAGIGGTG